GRIRKRLRKTSIAVHAAGVVAADVGVVAAMPTRYPDNRLHKTSPSQKLIKRVVRGIRVAAPRRSCYPVSRPQNIGMKKLASKAADRLLPKVDRSPSRQRHQPRNLYFSHTASV